MTDDQTTRNKPAKSQQKKQQKPSKKPATTHQKQQAKYIIDTACSMNSLYLPELLMSNQAMDSHWVMGRQ